MTDARLLPLLVFSGWMLTKILRDATIRLPWRRHKLWLGFAVSAWVGMAIAALPGGTLKQGCILLAAGALVLTWFSSTLRPGGGEASNFSSPWLWTSLILLLVWLTTRDLWGNPQALSRLPADLAAAACLLAACSLARRRPLSRLHLATIAMLGLVVASAIPPFLGSPWAACHVSKCGVFGELYVGSYDSENVLGLFAAVTLACVQAGWPRRARWFGTGYCLLVLIYTAARTSLAAAVLVLAVATLVPRLRSGSVGRATALPIVVAAGILVVGLRLIGTQDPNAFSGRGIIWMRAASVLQTHEVTGLGLSRWFELQDVGLLSFHFTHSLYLALLFSGGWIAIGIFAILIASLTGQIWRREGVSPPLAVIPLMVLLVEGLTEASFNPLTVDHLTWVFAGILMTMGQPVRPACEAAGSTGDEKLLESVDAWHERVPALQLAGSRSRLHRAHVVPMSHQAANARRYGHSS